MCVPLLWDTPLTQHRASQEGLCPQWRVQSPVLNSTVAGLAWVQEEVLPVSTPRSASAQSCAQRAASALCIFPGPAHPEQLLQRAEGSEQCTHWLQELFQNLNVHQQFTD